jgi:hypothetical protein
MCLASDWQSIGKRLASDAQAMRKRLAWIRHAFASLALSISPRFLLLVALVQSAQVQTGPRIAMRSGCEQGHPSPAFFAGAEIMWSGVSGSRLALNEMSATVS